MIKVTYAQNGQVVPDAHVHRWGEELLQAADKKSRDYVKKRDAGSLTVVAETALVKDGQVPQAHQESPDMKIVVGAEIMILLLVSYIYNGRVAPGYIDFYREGKKEPLRKAERRNGKTTVNFEPGFCDVYDKICNTIVGS